MLGHLVTSVYVMLLGGQDGGDENHQGNAICWGCWIWWIGLPLATLGGYQQCVEQAMYVQTSSCSRLLIITHVHWMLHVQLPQVANTGFILVLEKETGLIDSDALVHAPMECCGRALLCVCLHRICGFGLVTISRITVS